MSGPVAKRQPHPSEGGDAAKNTSSISPGPRLCFKINKRVQVMSLEIFHLFFNLPPIDSNINSKFFSTEE